MFEIRQFYFGENVENTLYVRFGAPPDSGDLAAAAVFIDTAWRANIIPMQSESLTYSEIFCTDLTSATGPTHAFNTGLPISGESGDEGEASNVAACISLRTESRGRSFRGRNYICGLPSGFISGKIMDGVLMDAYTAGYEAIIAALTGGGLALVVVSRFSGFTIVDGVKVPTPRTTGLATEVTSVSFTDNIVTSQRGRLR